MNCDYHVHIGQYCRAYYYADRVFAALKACGTDELWFSSTTSCMYCKESAAARADTTIYNNSPAAAELYCSIRSEVQNTLEVAAELEHHMRRLGSERPAFQTIIASGVRGSLPHGVASDKVITSGELVTMDFGAVCGGYHSDITRTICVGRADERQRELYGAVLSAQKCALAALHPGVTGVEVDHVARKSLAEKNLDQYFGHGLGHSLGLEIHEEPRLSKAGHTRLLPNMLITDEPGVYIPGWGGIRIEDTVLITADGAEPLTHAPKEFIEICQ